MSLNDDPTKAAWWVTGIIGFGVAMWKIFFNFKRDARDDHEGKGRLDLIERLQEEIRRQGELIVTLDKANEDLTHQVDEEIARRRVSEEREFIVRQRVHLLEHKLRSLGQEP